MKTRYSYLSVLFFSFIICKAQTFPWAIAGQGTQTWLNEGLAICTDPSDNIFATGTYGAANFAIGSTTITPTFGGGIFLTKLDVNGNVLWAKRCTGGPNTSVPYSIKSDPAGNIYMTGTMSGTNSFGAYTLTSAGSDDIFLTKFDPNGNVLWAKSAGGTNLDISASVSSDPAGNAIITGNFASASIAFGTTTLTNTGSKDIFVAKYDPTGNVLWAKSYGGNGLDGGSGVSTDPTGNSFITGVFNSSTITFGAYTLTLTATGGGAKDMFLTKLDPNGNTLWATKPYAPNGDSAYAVSADGSGNAYVAGNSFLNGITFGTYSLTTPGFKNMFLAKYDNNGNVLWAKGTSGGGNGAYAVSSHSAGVNVAGFVSASSQISFGTGTITPPPGSTDPIFIAKYDLNGNFICGNVLASGGDDNGGIASDKAGNAYVCEDFIPISFVVGTTTLTGPGPSSFGEDVFIAKFNCTPNAVNELSGGQQINIFPNPVSNNVTVELGNTAQKDLRIELLDVTGKTIRTATIITGQNKMVFDLQSISAGVYFIKIPNGNSYYSEKIIVTKD